MEKKERTRYNSNSVNMATYQVHLTDHRTTEFEAAKIHIGTNKFWMYDSDDHLVAVFPWDRMEGFQVIGSAADQVIVEGDLPHESKQKINEQIARKEKRGEFLSELETARDALNCCDR